MTRGERLKTLLGLDGYRYVVFERLLEFPVMAITIYYDSHRPNLPLTNDLLHRRFHFFSVRKPPYTKNLPVTPIMALEYYNAGSDPAVIFIVDVGGDLTDPKNQIPRKIESSKVYTPRLDEWVTLRALQNPASVDAFTRGFQTIRRKAVGAENITAKPLNVFYDDKRDLMRFTFITTATVPVYPPQTQFKKTDPKQSFDLKRNPDKQYHIQIQILEFMKWLKDTRPDELADQPITRKEIKDVLDVAYVQVWCDCPSFHWQSMNYNLSQLDGSIHPTDIAPHYWNQPHLHGDGENFLCKHLAGFVNQIDFFLNPMAAMATKILKKKGLI